LSQVAVNEKDLADITSFGSRFSEDDLRTDRIQKRMLACCKNEEAKTALLHYIVVDRGIDVKWVVPELLFGDRKRQAAEFDSLRLKNRKVSEVVDTAPAAEIRINKVPQPDLLHPFLAPNFSAKTVLVGA